MNKTELIDQISNKVDVSKSSVNKIVDAFIETVKETIKNGDSVTLIGFGTFETSIRAERNGRNPRTGEMMKIKKSIVPKFRPGKGLKEAVN
ncbi:DNA-binding protein HU-beta [Candidatus Kinetoplastibacterium sorsogonicusi]|uniref:DNA-binding protein HU-beta n=1 Tax=Candidatus Kinetoplastidibacterium kentomonadis TaxID=1576550 RepID=A0A3S7J9X2_9PROT|nr:HU family DNA-binding protein [Candidatus Kinetoplastibacterium sorsogonicusi]AWD32459.1 DNA-binding protein HU-beta [Candidatus Kinetoplastibacterium sorsogonicusi]